MAASRRSALVPEVMKDVIRREPGGPCKAVPRRSPLHQFLQWPAKVS